MSLVPARLEPTPGKVADPGRESEAGSPQRTINLSIYPKNGHSMQTVLLADHDDSIRIFVEAILSAMGLQVLRVRDGRQALLESQTYKHRIAFLLSDIQIGRDITGIELATQLHLERPDMGILLMSGSNSEAEVQDAGWEFIRKPFLPDSLKRKIQSLLVNK